MARVGLEPAGVFNIATIGVQSVGLLLIVSGRSMGFGAAVLGVFTALTVPRVHHFWTMTEEPFRTMAIHTTSEHVGVIGGLIEIAALFAVKDNAAPISRRYS